jgi:hypothetical protein
MKPDWKKIVFGIFIMFVILVALVMLDSKFRLIKILQSLPEGQARGIGLSIIIFSMSLFSILGFLLSKKKGRDPLRWTFLCFFFQVWALIYLWSLPGLNDRRKTDRHN